MQSVFAILFYWIVIYPEDFEQPGPGVYEGERGKQVKALLVLHSPKSYTEVKGP